MAKGKFRKAYEKRHGKKEAGGAEKKAPPHMHRMPDGHMMRDSEMPKKPMKK